MQETLTTLFTERSSDSRVEQPHFFFPENLPLFTFQLSLNYHPFYNMSFKLQICMHFTSKYHYDFTVRLQICTSEQMVHIDI